MQDDKKTWGVQKLENNAVTQCRVGPLLIWLERTGDELHYAFSRKETDYTSPKTPKPDHIEWSRWVCGEGALDLALTPALPPRPMVVRPAMPLQILPGHHVRFFVSIPVYVAGVLVASDKQERVTAFEEPTVVLSNSWYGKPADGTLCYALRTRARRSLDELRTDPHLAICPLELVNESSKPLLFERILLRSALMGIYRGTHHNWTSVARLLYRGEEPLPECTYALGVPQYDDASVCLAEPKDQVKRKMLGRAMDSIRGGLDRVRHG